ncbi:SGNH/GDSL hydrolase family protein [Thermoleophilia bacterium SCSIO 60948]|nr:SGNH/GDSL hydrolase family protein [Thermoleophilia bacterium SCSIO 60948]
MTRKRYVALGDSTTEGLDDPYPGTADEPRGWADRLAEQLAVLEPELLYANLAIRGRKVGQIRAEQLEPALAMDPDLASVAGGLNDILRPSVDVDAVAGDLEAMASALRESGAEVLMMSYPDPTAVISVAGARVRERVGRLNSEIRRIVAATGARLIELEREGVAHPALWSPDRLHANSLGHERIAAAAAEALELPGATAIWTEPLPPAETKPRLARAAEDAAWTARHLAPWVLRRVRGRSSGDGRSAKRPELAPLGRATEAESTTERRAQ